MRSVMGYVLDAGKVRQFLAMPKGAKALSVQVQDETPVLFAETEEKEEREDRCFEIFSTGDRMVSGMGVDRRYVGTFQLRALAFHVYERTGV